MVHATCNFAGRALDLRVTKVPFFTSCATLGKSLNLLWALSILLTTLHGNVGEVNWVELVAYMGKVVVLLLLEVLQSEGIIKHGDLFGPVYFRWVSGESYKLEKSQRSLC